MSSFSAWFTRSISISLGRQASIVVVVELEGWSEDRVDTDRGSDPDLPAKSDEYDADGWDAEEAA